MPLVFFICLHPHTYVSVHNRLLSLPIVSFVNPTIGILLQLAFFVQHSFEIHPPGHKRLWLFLFMPLWNCVVMDATNCPLLRGWSIFDSPQVAKLPWPCTVFFIFFSQAFNNPIIDRDISWVASPQWRHSLPHRGTLSIPREFWEVFLSVAYIVKILHGIFPLTNRKLGFNMEHM